MKLNAEKREKLGTSASKQARVQNKVPAVIYGKDFDATSILLERRPFEDVLRELGRNAVFTIAVDGKESEVMIKNIDHSALKPEFYNIELLALKKGQTVQVAVPVVISNPEIIKEGVLTQTLTELEIESLATKIPHEISVELKEMEIGDNVTVEQLELPEGVTVITEADTPVAVVSAPTVEEEPADADAEAAAEPEVIGEDATEE